MLSIDSEKFIEFEDNVSVVRVKMFADTVDELPDIDEFTGKKLAIGSECCVTGTGDRYAMTSMGEWVKLNFNGGGEGGGGTDNYNALTNKPQINNVTLNGNKSSCDLGISPKTIGENLIFN